MKIEINNTLYHADWCGYCKQFLPTWSEFAKKVSQLPHNKIKYTTNSFEESDLNKGEMPTISGKEIRGFPTVKTTIRVDDSVQEIEYTGSRKMEDMLEFLEKISDKVLKKTSSA